jgi:hypothetical protein
MMQPGELQPAVGGLVSFIAPFLPHLFQLAFGKVEPDRSKDALASIVVDLNICRPHEPFQRRLRPVEEGVYRLTRRQ